MKLALAQLSSGTDREENVERALRAMDEAASRGAEMIVYPEVVLERFFPQERGCRDAAVKNAEPIPGPTTEKLSAKAAEHGLVVVFNLYEDAGDGRYYGRLAGDRRGRKPARHDAHDPHHRLRGLPRAGVLRSG